MQSKTVEDAFGNSGLSGVEKHRKPIMDQLPSWVNAIIAIGGAIGTLVTAVATFFLWRVTKTLARETTRMAEAALSHMLS